MSRRALLACGVLSTIVYLTADLVGTLHWQGYSYVDQTISELAALDAPSRPFVVPLFIAYNILLTAFAAGVALSGARGARNVAAMLATIGLLGVAASFFPISTRAHDWTINETMHSVLTGLTVIALLVGMGFAAGFAGPGFRIYSIVTIAITLAAGALSEWIGRGLASDQPTPWIGIIERVSVFSYLLWVAVLAVFLMRASPKTFVRERRAA
jgi:hypothetical protein